jgi:hypothetical protein
MTPGMPQIGFDRFIDLTWVAMAINVRLGTSSLDELNTMLDVARLGKEARAKTRTKLNALVLEPRADMVEFIDRGVSGCRPTDPDQGLGAFAWGAAIATYPFFGKVAEFTGRLTSLQGDCSVAEIHRRMSEVYGDRQVTKRATQAVIQTQANWGAIKRIEQGKRLARLDSKMALQDPSIAWLVEAALRYHGKAIAIASLPSMAVVYPFEFNQHLPYLLSNSPALELRSDGSNRQMVDLRGELWEHPLSPTERTSAFKRRA